jgi:hypothetical protein
VLATNARKEALFDVLYHRRVGNVAPVSYYRLPATQKSANDFGHVEKLILCFASSKFHVSIFVV